MKFFVKKSAPQKSSFTIIDKPVLKQVKGGTEGEVAVSQGLIVIEDNMQG